MFNNLIEKENRINFLSDAFVFACCIMSLGFSIIESRLNTDAHHWGWMYANAASLNNGLIPYRDIFIQYGFLTTLIHGFSLKILGNTVVSVGIITGIFYAASIYLTYLLLQKILARWLAGLSAALLFLIHPYIIYPWANYLAYTLFLASLLLLVKTPERLSRYFLAGFFMALAVLARQTFLASVLIPVYLYFIIKYLSTDLALRSLQRRAVLMFHLGILCVVLGFAFILFRNCAINDWALQSFKISGIYGFYSFVEVAKLLLAFGRNIILAKSFAGTDLRLWLYTLAFLNNLLIAIRSLSQCRKVRLGQKDLLLLLFALVALFGYFQSFHIYEVFRLQNASSLGIGLLVFSLYHGSTRLKRWKRITFAPPVIGLVIYLSVTLLFTRTTSVYFPWDENLIFSRQLGAPQDLAMLEWKLYTPPMRRYYELLSQELGKYKDKLKYLVNYSFNCYVPFLSSGYKVIQGSPVYGNRLFTIFFPLEQEEIERLLSQGQAILISQSDVQIPDNYRIVLKLKFSSIPWISDTVFVAVPKNIASNPAFMEYDLDIAQ